MQRRRLFPHILLPSYQNLPMLLCCEAPETFCAMQFAWLSSPNRHNHIYFLYLPFDNAVLMFWLGLHTKPSWQGSRFGLKHLFVSKPPPSLNLQMRKRANEHIMRTWYATFGANVNLECICGLQKVLSLQPDHWADNDLFFIFGWSAPFLNPKIAGNPLVSLCGTGSWSLQH